MRPRHLFVASGTSLLICITILSCATSSPEGVEAEQLREVERQRLRSLVDVDVETADRLHGDDFQLITPTGDVLSKQEYLAALTSGQLDYVAWEAGDITVRLYGAGAVLRYRDSRFDVNFPPDGVHRGPMHHTNLYERRAGQWQIVWSQASGVVGQ